MGIQQRAMGGGSRDRKIVVKVKEHHDDPALLPPQPMSPSPVADGFDDHYGYYDGEEGEEDDDEYGSRGSGEPPLKKGPWTPDEDRRLMDYVQEHGDGNWNQVRINAGLNRCGKSCRLRWSNHLRPDLKKAPFDDEEVEKIIKMHMAWGNKWAQMASVLPGRTDNEIKNFWNTRTKRHDRAGIPIYPAYLVSQASNQDMKFGPTKALSGTKRSNEVSPDILRMNNLMYDYFDHDTFVKLVSLRNVDDSNGNLSFAHVTDEYAKAGCSTSFNPGMTENQLAPPDNAIVTGHPILDGNPSGSWTTQRSMKTELPSVQYSNYGLTNACVHDFPSGYIEQADSLIASPGSLKSESISSQNIGLDAIGHKGDGMLDPIMYQGVFEVPSRPVLCNEVSQSNAYTMWRSFVSPGDDEIEGCPLGIQASKSPSSSDAILAESKCYPDTSFIGTPLSTWVDTGTLTASVEASLLNDRSLFSKDQSISICNSFLYGDSSEEAKLSTADNSVLDGDFSEEAKLSTAAQGLDSIPWNSMPGACNMPDDDFSNL